MPNNGQNIWPARDLICSMGSHREKTSTTESIKASLIVMVTMSPMPLMLMTLLHTFKVAKAYKKGQPKLGTKKSSTIILQQESQPMENLSGILLKLFGRKLRRWVSGWLADQTVGKSKTSSLPGTVRQETLS